MPSEPLFINVNEPKRRFGLLKDTLAEVPNALANPLQTLDYGLSTVGRWARGNLQAKSQQISADPVEAALNFTGGGMRNVAAKAPQVFEGFTDLSTKLIEKLKGRTTVSRQYIEDLTNSPDLKQPERDLIREYLAKESGEVNVPLFANKVVNDERVLPLKRSNAPSDQSHMEDAYGNMVQPGRYENITLPDELRGPVANYSEHLYNSPIKTSAGDVHFSDAPNYFAHTRIEDLPALEAKVIGKDINGWPMYDMPDTTIKGGTRRVIEIQSDLFQKGRLADEATNAGMGRLAGLHDADDIIQRELTPEQYRQFVAKGGVTSEKKSAFLNSIRPGLADRIKAETEGLAKSQISAKQAEIAKLEPYRNTWHERIIREEVKQAAKDGKTKLQFPTGETAMKIEGLGETKSFITKRADGGWYTVKIDDLEVGREITRNNGGQDLATLLQGDRLIITDVLGDGRFKAVAKNSIPPEQDIETVRESLKESFDISGKVDTSNPIYRFYEKEVQKYLRNKYGAKVVTDPQGVTWVEVDIKKDYKKLPIEAFGIGALPLMGERGDNKERRFKSEPLFIQQ